MKQSNNCIVEFITYVETKYMTSISQRPGKMKWKYTDVRFLNDKGCVIILLKSRLIKMYNIYPEASKRKI